MKRLDYFKSLLLMVMAMAVATVSAANVDAVAAQARAVQFMNSQPGIRMMASTANLKLTHAEKSAVNAKANDYYVFNYEGGGYVIVSGDDRAEEILGYGSGRMDVNNLPSNVAWWLNQYKQQMEWLIANPKAQVETTTQFMSTMLTATTVPMLMTSRWDQEAPYYNQCPKYNGQYCMTGCVATAMAQVMYYWKYPAELPALDAYTTAETPRFNVPALPGITLDWDNMLDDYSSVNYNTTQANAVAWLMRYCGQAVQMMYSPDGSGAYTEDECAAMIKFGYSSDATVKYRDDHNTTNWNAMMQAELEAGRPILYGGNDYYAGGHAFVVDGYNASTSKYHVNFGWSGYDDNYYALDAFKGSGYTFNYYQDMIIGVYPESTLEKHAPVLAEAGNVGTTSFRASWTDETPGENVTDYTLYVTQYDPNQVNLLTETFAGVTVTNDGTSNIANSLDTYCDNSGWTGSYVYQGAGGTMKVGSGNYAGSLTTPALDMSTCGGTITVKFNAKYYGSDNSSVVVSCGSASQTVALTASAADYTVVLTGVNAAAGQTVTFAGTAKKKRFYIDNIEIVTGDASMMFKAVETGDASSRIITGITAKNYTVNNLNEGGSYRFYVEANYTDGTKKQSNVKIVTLEGTAVPTPEIVVDPEALTMAANVGENATATFDVLAADLTGNVTVTLTDANGVYTVNPTTISKADAEDGATVTVTYAPTATGTHEATVTVTSEGAQAVTVTLNGTATMQTVAPVLAAATNVTTTSFKAVWTDATPAANVKDYTLYVNKAGSISGLDLLLSETFSGVTAENDGTARIESNLDDYCDNAGWTGSYIYQAGGGGLKFGNSSNGGTLVSPDLDMTNSGCAATVVLNAKNYGTDVTTLTVSCGSASKTIELTDAAADYTLTLEMNEAAAGQHVTIASNGSKQRFYLYSVEIYSGGFVKGVSETGDANHRTITGITDKNYTVENLTPGETYNFHVVANYVDGSNAASNIEQVTLVTAVVPEIVVDPETLAMTANVGETVTTTFDVLAAELTGDVTVTLTDENGVFSLEPTSISKADAEEGATITVTYAPTTVGEHTATITIASEGAQDVTVAVTGTAAMPLGELVMLPADGEYITTSSFRADWTDETNEAYIQDYSLHVNKAGGISGLDLLLSEAFGGVTAENDGTARIDSNLDDYCDNAGWTGSYIYQAGGGGLKLGNSSNGGTLVSPPVDLTNSGCVVTVVLNAMNYGTDATTLTVSCGSASETIELTAEAQDYTLTLEMNEAAADQQVTIASSGSKQRFYLYSVDIYNGGLVKAVSETGNENSRIITGITDKHYVVEGLTAGETYEYYVIANYVDGTSRMSNIEQVTLLEDQGHGYQVGDVNHDGDVDIADVTALIDMLLNGGASGCPICGDVNPDGEVNIADVTSLVDSLLGGN